MRKLISPILLIILSSVIFSCAGDKIVRTEIDNEVDILGQWSGTVWAQYPGADDGPIVTECGINFTFYDNDRYVFFWEPWVGLRAYAAGTYSIHNDSIFLIETTTTANMQPYNLQGGFLLNKSDSLLLFAQILHPDSWPEIHRIRLIPGHIIF